MIKPVSINDLEEITGYSRDKLLRLAKKDVVKRTDRGKYDLPGTIRGIIEELKEQNKPVASADKGKLDGLKAEKLQIELRHMKGELIEVEDITDTMGKIIQATRARILAHPKKAAPLLVGCKSVVEAEDILKRQTSEILNDLSSPDFTEIALGRQKEKRQRAIKRKK